MKRVEVSPDDEFIALKAKSIWETPHAMYLLFFDFSPSAYLTSKFSYKVPQKVSQIIRLIDGSSKVTEIVEKMKGDYDSILFFLDLVNNLKSEGLLLISRKREQRFINHLGSNEYFVPLHVAVEVTNRCNLNCSYCYNYYNRRENKHDLLYEDVMRVLKTSFSEGTRICQFTGGEPFLHARIRDLIMDACDLFENVIVVTNGTLLDDKLIKFLGEFRERLSIQVSLDSIDSTRYFHSGRNTEAKQILITLEKLKKERIHTSISSTLTAGAEEVLSAVVRECKRIGVDSFSLSECGSWGNVELSSEYLRVERSLLKDYYLFESLGEFLAGEGNCGAGWKSVAIKSNGDIVPCLTFEDGLKIGSIDSFGSWQKFNLDGFYNMKAPEASTCTGCRFFPKCSGCISKPFALKEQCPAYVNYYKRIINS